MFTYFPCYRVQTAVDSVAGSWRKKGVKQCHY